MEIKKFTNAEIIAKNEISKVPCITESGECVIVKEIKLYIDDEVCEVEKVLDFAVFTTDDEAISFISKIVKQDAHREACSCIKHSYVIEHRFVF